LTQTIEITPNLAVAIDGSGQVVTLSGNQETTVFYVLETAKLTLLNLTIADGVTVPLGGGILNRGAVTVTNSTFTNHWAYGGGAIANTGTLLVQNSTFTHNVADGGGFYSSGGGGILNYQGVVTITNSTFTDNVCVDDIGGAINNVQGTVSVTNVTFADNSATAGGSIANADTLVTKNSLIAGSPVGGNCSGTLAASSTHNLSDDDTCGASFAQVDAAALNLGAPANNGGPTATIALNAGSVAIDAGEDASCPPTDQRGVGRPAGTHCDIGAFEFQPLVYLPVIAK
jgi:hypothetical protein